MKTNKFENEKEGTLDVPSFFEVLPYVVANVRYFIEKCLVLGEKMDTALFQLYNRIDTPNTKDE